MLLPGGVLPAEPAYAALLAALDESVDAVAKDLEVYAGEEPPTDYTLEAELDGIIREAAAHGFDRFHVVGYSAGGASSVAFAAKQAERSARRLTSGLSRAQPPRSAPSSAA